MERPDVAELDSLLAGQTEQAPTEGAPTPEEVEQVEYFLGGKPNKLPLNAEFSFSHDGKVVKAPLSTMVNHYRQRAELDGQFGKLKAERSAWEQERGEADAYKQLQAKYGAIQDWSEKNPQDWQTLWELYQNKDKHLLTTKMGADPNQNPLIEEITKLKSELSGLHQFKSSFEERQAKEQQMKDVEEVNGEIASFQKEFPKINLDEKDSNGVSLKYKIMEFGVDRRIPDFESAALKYLKPRLLELTAQQSRQEAVKTVQKDKAAGILARSSTPFHSGQSAQVNPKKSWNELDRMAKAELDQALRS